MNPSRPILFLENLIEISLGQTSCSIVFRLIEFERNYKRRRWQRQLWGLSLDLELGNFMSNFIYDRFAHYDRK